MKTGLIITTFNRPEYLRQCFESIKATVLPEDLLIVIADDSSTNPETLQLISDFNINGIAIIKIRNEKNSKIYNSLANGYDKCWAQKCDVVINLDGDAIVKPDFFKRLLKLQQEHPANIVTGFNSENKNLDGKDRHQLYDDHSKFDDYWLKKSVGGINMVVNYDTYFKYILPALNNCINNKRGNWDHLACIESMKANFPIVVGVPSVVQHIGFDSSMNHIEAPDVASDFENAFELDLPNVTLIGIDCVSIQRLIHAANISSKHIRFGAIKLLTSQKVNDERIISIPDIRSKDEYSLFMLKDLHKYVDTEFALVIQHDGYLINYKAWDNDFLNYDYIGATWWFKDGMNVGNGGFSLRSKRLLEVTSDDSTFITTGPEDELIGRKFRKYLEKQYDIKFAWEDMANRFSIEAHNSADKKYSGQLGFHGWGVDFTGAKLDHIPSRKQVVTNTIPAQAPAPSPAQPSVNQKPVQKKRLAPSQYFGLGDIIFSMALIEDFIKLGYDIVWDVQSDYVNIQKHFPHIKFRDKKDSKINHERKEDRILNDGTRVIPIRWADQILKRPFKDVMRAKYDLYHIDWNRWREVTWVRDEGAENRLFFEMLKLTLNEEYTLVNRNFRSNQTGKAIIDTTGLPGKIIEMQAIEGYTLFDWGKVIENATQIHTVSTSVNYMMEVMELKAKELHLYLRKPDEKDFTFVDYIFKKPYIYHG